MVLCRIWKSMEQLWPRVWSFFDIWRGVLVCGLIKYWFLNVCKFFNKRWRYAEDPDCYTHLYCKAGAVQCMLMVLFYFIRLGWREPSWQSKSGWNYRVPGRDERIYIQLFSWSTRRGMRSNIPMFRAMSVQYEDICRSVHSDTGKFGLTCCVNPNFYVEMYTAF